MDVIFDRIVLYLDNTPATLGTALKVAREAKAEFEKAMIHGKENRRHVATTLRKWIVNDAVDVFPHRDQVTKDHYRDAIYDLKDCKDWEHIKYWLPVADHYLEKIAEGVEVDWAIRE